jgi:hypothetical protein
MKIEFQQHEVWTNQVSPASVFKYQLVLFSRILIDLMTSRQPANLFRLALVALFLAIEMSAATALEPPPRFAAMYGDPAVFVGRPEPWRGGDGLVCRSLGNFMFDQQNGSGALAEVRFFEDETFAVRWIPIKNLLQAEATKDVTVAR